MNISRSELRRLELQRGRPAGALVGGHHRPRPLAPPASPEAAGLTVVIPCKLANPLNGSHGGWAKHARAAKARRNRAGLLILQARAAIMWTVPARVPKRITFSAFVHNLFDDDGLRAACKNERDALTDLRIIEGDGPHTGHVFEYVQAITRGPEAFRGLIITVEVRG